MIMIRKKKNVYDYVNALELNLINLLNVMTQGQ